MASVTTTPITLYDELKARGLVRQVTNEEEISKMINAGKAVFYIGFDPTADSLHVGHFMALTFMKRLQMAGNKPIALIGGGTGMIGDPSNRTDLRDMMTAETINHHCECFKRQMSNFIDFSSVSPRETPGSSGETPGSGGETLGSNDETPGSSGGAFSKALMVNNADWLLGLNYIEFLREYGVSFSVNKMLAAECYKSRMEKGLSFLEFNYMILQSYDFLELYKRHGCNMQFGGDDQWSNMLGGTELIRKKLGVDAHALTITLLLNSEGEKMGKTSKGAVWLDANKTTPFEFYQYWRNVADADVVNCMKMLTFLPLDQIEEVERQIGEKPNEAKELLAYELTALVHGIDTAKQVQETSKELFRSGVAADMPTVELTDADFTDGEIDILTLLVKSGLCASKGEARRAVEQGGVEANGKKVTAFATRFGKGDFGGGAGDSLRGIAGQARNDEGGNSGLVLRRGKKNYRKIVSNGL